MESWYCVRVGLDVFEDVNASMEDSSKADEEHVQITQPTVGLLGGTLDVHIRGGLLEERGFDVESHVTLAECVLDHGSRLGWPKAELVIVVVGVFHYDEKGEISIAELIKICDGAM